ncbi:MAG TPA: hypothetical protein VEI96_13360 [Thermodesulfovibrionales bacterium]|nr:hypothetical protein [Thermodesulfovibrionales bacterium]
MKKATRNLDELFLDIAFAAEREFNFPHGDLHRIAREIEDTLVAVAFAEAGEFETAVGCPNKGGENTKQQRPGCRTRTFTRLCAGKA